MALGKFCHKNKVILGDALTKKQDSEVGGYSRWGNRLAKGVKASLRCEVSLWNGRWGAEDRLPGSEAFQEGVLETLPHSEPHPSL